MKTAEEFVTFGQGNVEALVKSSQILMAGMQDLTKQMAASAQASFDEAFGTFKAIAAARSVREAMELQAGFARSALEKAMTQSGQVAETTLKLGEQVAAPITSRFSLAVETFGRPS
jgi:phasin family protein